MKVVESVERRYRTSAALVDSWGEVAYEAMQPEGFDLWLVVRGDRDVSWHNTRRQAMEAAVERNNARNRLLNQREGIVS